MESSSRENKYIRAKERVAEIKKFYSNLTSYAVFIGFLAIVNYYTNEWSYPWFLWAAFGWGIGLFFQALKVFQFNLLFGKNWEQRKIEEFMKEEENHKKWE
ncbi:MAG: 2TM domain-containing protein [Flavobacteriales bacterium]